MPTYYFKVQPSFGTSEYLDSDGKLGWTCSFRLCLPRRYKWTTSWLDVFTGMFVDVFRNVTEAWDHKNFTNPNTASQYNGSIITYAGYGGVLIEMDVTDGVDKWRVRIVAKNEEYLVANLGSKPVQVNNPPGSMYLDTNGAVYTGYVELGKGQYAYWYRDVYTPVDTTKLLFARSPLGTGKTYPYEAYFKLGGGTVVYTGVKAPSDVEVDNVWSGGGGSSYPSSGGTTYNGSGLLSGFGPGFVSIIDPTYNVYLYRRPIGPTYVGWVEDDAGNVVGMFIQTYGGTMIDLSGDVFAAETGYVYYDFVRGESTVYVREVVNKRVTYRYLGYYPSLGVMSGSINASNAYYIDVNDNVNPLAWGNIKDGWGVYYETGAGVYMGLVHVGDSVDGTKSQKVDFFLWPRVMPRVLYGANVSAGSIYEFLYRFRVGPSFDFRAWATRVAPYLMGDVKIVPLTRLIKMASTNISVSVPSSVYVGRDVSVSISAPAYSNSAVDVYFVDPVTGVYVSRASGTLDSRGNGTVTVKAPGVGTYWVVAVARGARGDVFGFATVTVSKVPTSLSLSVQQL